MSEGAVDLRACSILTQKDKFDWATINLSALALSLALLTHWAGDKEFATKYHAAFAHGVIAQLPVEKFELSSLEIARTIAKLATTKTYREGKGFEGIE